MCPRVFSNASEATTMIGRGLRIPSTYLEVVSERAG
jgi:hypothetical protein